jgi:hypothetical protein
MSSIYTADGTQVTPPAGAQAHQPIVLSTFASPIKLTITAHGLNQGDTVEVEGHLVNTAANGQWTVTVIDANNVTLNGSTGNGVGGATGYLVSYQLLPAITLPGAGELVDVGTSNPPLEAVDNLGPFLYRLGGKYRLYGLYTGGANAVGNALESSWSSATIAYSAGVNQLVDLTSGTGLLGFNAAPTAAPIVKSSDILVATLSTTIATSVPNNLNTIGVSLSVSVNGGSYTAIRPVVSFFPNGGSLLSPAIPLAVNAFVTTLSGTFDYGIKAWSGTAGPSGSLTVNLLGAWELVVKHYRVN